VLQEAAADRHLKTIVQLVAKIERPSAGFRLK
jgi:hypothetical protein